MTYYEREIAELRAGCVTVRELGDEIAICGGDTLYIGGDAPVSLERPQGWTDAEALETARRARTIYRTEDDGAWERYLESMGAVIVPA